MGQVGSGWGENSTDQARPGHAVNLDPCTPLIPAIWEREDKTMCSISFEEQQIKLQI